MENIGHFPMSENPDLFKEYLMPVLKKIVQSDREAGRSTDRAGRDPGRDTNRDTNRDMSRDEPGRSAERASQGRATAGVESPSYRNPTSSSADRGSVRVLDVDSNRSSRARR